MGFEESFPMVHGAREIGVRERNASERTGTKSIARRWFVCSAEKEARHRIDEGVPKAIENDTCNISLCVEA